MFTFVVFAPLLVAITAGTFLYIWANKNGSSFGQLVGLCVTLLALILTALEGWHVIKMWHDPGFTRDMQKMMHQMPAMEPEKK